MLPPTPTVLHHHHDHHVVLPPADSILGSAVRILTRSGAARKHGRDAFFAACRDGASHCQSEPDLSRSEGPAVKTIAEMWRMRTRKGKGKACGPSPLALRVLQWVVENEDDGQ